MEFDKVELLKTYLIDQESFAQFGFNYKSEAENFYQDSIGDVFTFKVNKGTRSIDIYFRTVQESFNIHIHINNEEHADEDEDQAVEYSFSLEQWLDEKGQSPIKYPFHLDSYEGTLQEQMQQFFAFLDQALQDDTLQKILQGEIWDYVSFDWGDMK